MTSQPWYSLLSSQIFFWGFQGIFITFVAGSAWLVSVSANHRPFMPIVNNTPRTIRPEYDNAAVVTDDQLNTVLYKIRPRFKEQVPKINFIDHGLRLWGKSPQVGSDSLSGKQLYAMLTDHPTYTRNYGKKATPLLSISSSGIAVTTRESRTSVSHVDHLMGTLSEIGTPLSYHVKTPELQGTVGDILKHAVKNFRLNQREYEWTALALAMYIKEGQHWFSNDGQRLDFNLIADRIMRQQQPQGVCYGQHRLYTLTMLLRVNKQLRDESQNPILSAEQVANIHDYLLDMSRRLYQSQSPDGYWDGNWFDAESPVPDPTTNELSRRLLATGHSLEWWAMAPQTLHPPRETIVRAAQWMTRVITEMDDESIAANYTFLTHSARSLVLWRGKFADEVDVKVPEEITNELEKETANGLSKL